MGAISIFKVYLKKLFPYLGSIIFSFFFLITLLPQFLIVKQPLFHSDSHLYAMQAMDIFNGKIPLEGYDMEFPYGLGIFIAINYLMGGNLFTSIIIQSIIQFSLLLWLIKLIKKYQGHTISLISGLLLGLFFSISEMILWNTLPYTESLFISSLVFTGIQVYKYIQEERKKNLHLIFVGIFLGVLIRSNAIYLFFIPALAFMVKKNIRKDIIIGMSCLLISLSLSNYVFRGSFSPVETKRYVLAFQQLHSTHVKGEIQQVKDPARKRTVASQAIKLFTNLGKSEMGNHYYYRIPILLVKEDPYKFWISHIKSDSSINYHVPDYPFDKQEYFEFVTKDVSGTKEVKEKLCNIEIRPRHPILLALNYYHFVRFIIRNHIFTILFYLSFIYTLYFYFKDKSNKTLMSSLMFGLIHLVSIFLLAVHTPADTSLTRYAIVTELFCYLTIAFTVSEVFKKRKLLNEKHISS